MRRTTRGASNPYLSATPEQIKFALDLEIEFPEDITIGDLSVLIDEAKACRPPSDEQLRLCRKIDLKVPDGINMYDLSDLMDVRIAELTSIAGRNPLLRAGRQISYNLWPYTVGKMLTDGNHIAVMLERAVDAGPRSYRPIRVPLYLLASAREPTSAELSKPLTFS